jgi:hypothetical protein
MTTTSGKLSEDGFCMVEPSKSERGRAQGDASSHPVSQVRVASPVRIARHVPSRAPRDQVPQVGVAVMV